MDYPAIMVDIKQTVDVTQPYQGSQTIDTPLMAPMITGIQAPLSLNTVRSEAYGPLAVIGDASPLSFNSVQPQAGITDRNPDYVSNIVLRSDSDGPTPNYAVDANGNITELRSPSKGLGKFDNQIIVQFQDPNVLAAVESHKAQIFGLLKQIESQYPNAQLPPEYATLQNEAASVQVPPPQIRHAGAIGDMAASAQSTSPFLPALPITNFSAQSAPIKSPLASFSPDSSPLFHGSFATPQSTPIASNQTFDAQAPSPSASNRTVASPSSSETHYVRDFKERIESSAVHNWEKLTHEARRAYHWAGNTSVARHLRSMGHDAEVAMTQYGHEFLALVQGKVNANETGSNVAAINWHDTRDTFDVGANQCNSGSQLSKLTKLCNEADHDAFVRIFGTGKYYHEALSQGFLSKATGTEVQHSELGRRFQKFAAELARNDKFSAVNQKLFADREVAPALDVLKRMGVEATVKNVSLAADYINAFGSVSDRLVNRIGRSDMSSEAKMERWRRIADNQDSRYRGRMERIEQSFDA